MSLTPSDRPRRGILSLGSWSRRARQTKRRSRSGSRRRELSRFPLRERQRVNRHKFSTEITRSITSLYSLDNWHGPVAAAGDVLVIGISIGIGTIFPMTAPLAIFTIGSRMRALATLLHESSHTTLAANPALNRAIGTVAGYAIFQTFEAYKKSHGKEHHPYTGNPNHDPDLKFHIEAGLYDGLTPKRFLWRHIIKPGLALNVFKTLKYLLRDRFFGAVSKGASAEARKDVWTFAGFWTAIATVLTVAGLWTPFLLWWVLPYLTTFQIVNYFCEFGEHFPRPAQTDLDIAMSRNRLGSKFERLFFGMHNEHLHLEHHLAPGIPFWNLPKAREARLQDTTYAALDATSGGLFTRGPNGAPSIISQIMTWVASNAPVNKGE